MTTPASEDQAQAKAARYQIGEVAERTGVTQRTLRFYEEKGLLRPPERMDGGFRLYSDDDVQRIEYIRRLQQYLGFTLAEIKEMVEAEDLRQQIIATFRPDRELPARLERVNRIIGALERQLEVVDHKVEALAEMQGDLRGKLDRVTTRKHELEEAIAADQAERS
ncbi:MAG: MerR family transcriptional regulator [Dehalococcoidia bacterium]